MNDLLPDKPGKQQEYQWAQDIGWKNGPPGGARRSSLGVAFYFDIFVQRPINRRQK
jgi:hypothetical protein